MQRFSLVPLIVACVAISACDDSPDMPDSGGMCTAGTAGCACLEGSICQGGLICELGLCQGVDTIEIDVQDANARSCEVIIVEEETEVLDVVFGAGTLGTHVHESPRTAVTFSRETDTPFAPGAVTINRTESSTAALTLRLARCFDREGNVLGGAPLRLVD